MTVVLCCLSPQNKAVQFTLFTPSPPGTVKVIVEVVFQMPCVVMVLETSLVRLWTLHENTGGCDWHVCVTEHETRKVEPASTSGETGVITGFSGEAEDIKHKTYCYSFQNQQVILLVRKERYKKESFSEQTFHNNKYAAVESVSGILFLSEETERPIVKRLDVVNLQ